jgi:hypothetical protein
VSYTTDSKYRNSTISITPEILAAKAVVKESEFPLWVFIFIIIIIAFVIYKWIK